MADKIQIDADTSGAISKLNALDQKVSQLGGNFANAFGNMNIAATALGATLLAIGQQTAAFADNITDLAAANQMAVGEVLALSSALAQSGGSADSAGKLLQSLSNKVAEAAEGNFKTLGSFEKLGVSLQDLGSMSNTQIKDTLLKNIAAIEDPMQRNAKAVEVFGKSMMGVDVRKFAEDQAKNREEMEKFSPALETAGAAFDNVGKIFFNMKVAFAEAFEPLFKIISELNPSIDAMSVAFRGAAAALAVITGAAVIRGLLAIRSAIVAITVAAAANPFVALATGLLAVGTAAYTYFGLGKKGADAVTESTTKGSVATQKATRDISAATDAIEKQRDKLAQVGNQLQTNFDNASKKYQVDIANVGVSEQQRSIAEAIAKIDIDAATAKNKLQDEFNKLDDYLKTKLAGDHQEQLSRIDELAAKQKTAEEESIKQLAARKAAFEDLRSALNILGTASLDVAKLEAKTTIDSIGGINQRIAAEAQFNEVLQRRAAIINATSSLEAGDQIRVSQALDQATIAIARQAGAVKDLGFEFGETFSRALKDAGASSEVIQKVISGLAAQNGALARSTEAVTEAQQRAAENSRSFSAGWSKAFNDYVSNATNAASIATGIFNKFSSGIEDYFIDRLKGIDGGWKKFVAGLAEELARSQIRQLLARVLTFGGGGGMGGVLSGGAAGGGRGNSPSNPVFTNDITNKLQSIGGGQGASVSNEQAGFFEELKATISDFASNVGNFLSNMFSGLGNLISNLTSGIGSIVSSIGGTLFDVIGSIGGTLFDVIGSLGSGLGDILGSIGGGGGGGGLFSTLFDIGASLFGFANGGVIPSNKPVIVGERGPELLFGAGGMGVRSNEDSFGGSTVVTYNINAVDALSFKQMIAQDPTFLYAVTQQGAKGMPNRR